MSLTDVIKTHELDPLYFSQKRCEFSLPADKLYNSNIRVGNLGLEGLTGTTFLNSVGLKSIIRSIRLMDGNTELDVIRNYGDWSVVKEFNNTNSKNVDSANKKHYTDIGYTLGSLASGAVTATNVIEVVRPMNPEHTTHLDAEKTPKLFLELESEFDMLLKVGAIPTTLFKDFRVVLEFNQLSADILKSGFGAANQIMRPVLVVDEIVDPIEQKQALALFSQPVVWGAVELDIGRVQLETTTGVKKYTLRINGFDGKRVDKLVVTKKPSVAAPAAVKRACSVRQSGEKLQFLVNGSKLLPYSGIDAGANMALGYLTDAMGECNLNANQHNNALAGLSNDRIVNPDVYAMSGCFHMFGVNILDNIERLELEYERDTTSAQARYRQALELNCWGIVGKQLAVTKDGYTLSYA